MSMTNGEAATKNLTDKATYERLEKDVTAVKNDIAALTDQITDALNSFAGSATKQARRGYKQARANAEQARIYRKALGGGMRQAGVLAAAGLIALEEGPKRLHEDHANAKFLAEGLQKLRGVKINAEKVQTNIVVFEISGTGMDSSAFTGKLMEKNVLASGISPTEIRIVTHMDVDQSACERALVAISEFDEKNLIRIWTNC
jgi:threonine aldolase